MVLVYLLVVLVSLLVVLAFPLFCLFVCPCPLVVPVVLPVGLFITDLRNLLINSLSLIRVNSEAAAHQADVFRNRCSLKFCNIQNKHLCSSLFLIKLQACNSSVNIAKYVRTSLIIKHMRWLLLKYF